MIAILFRKTKNHMFTRAILFDRNIHFVVSGDSLILESYASTTYTNEPIIKQKIKIGHQSFDIEMLYTINCDKITDAEISYVAENAIRYLRNYYFG